MKNVRALGGSYGQKYMSTLTFIKFGGSVITDKTGEQAADGPVIEQLADELLDARRTRPDLPVIVGHGSGSFGHTAAARYGIHKGLRPDADWYGFAATSAAALRLNRILVDTMVSAGIPALSLQPSTTLVSDGGQLSCWDTSHLGLALERRLVPVIHGDVAFDISQGSAIISTEQLFTFLALHTDLRPSKILLVGEAAVYTADPRRDPHARPIPLVTEHNIATVLGSTGDSHGTDVTGGMRAKVELMWSLIEAVPGLQVQLIGTTPGLLSRALLGIASGEGTLMRKE